MSESDAGRGGAFGDLLRRHREAAGLSQEALAARSGISADAIGLLERGQRRRPRADTIRKLAAALGLDMAEQATLEASVTTGFHATGDRRLPLPAPVAAVAAGAFVLAVGLLGAFVLVRSHGPETGGPTPPPVVVPSASPSETLVAQATPSPALP